MPSSAPVGPASSSSPASARWWPTSAIRNALPPVRPASPSRARRAGPRPARREAPQELGDLRRRQAAEAQAGHAVEPVQVGERVGEVRGGLRRDLARAGEHQDGRARRGAGEVAHERKRGRIRPVQVVEHEHERAAARRGAQRRGDRGVEAVAAAAVVRDRGGRAGAPGGGLRHQRREPAAARRRHDRGLALRQLLEHLDERVVGTRARRLARAVEHHRAVLGRALGGLAREPRLSGPGLALEHGDAATVPARLREQPGQYRELGRAPDEGQRRREPQRTGKR